MLKLRAFWHKRVESKEQQKASGTARVGAAFGLQLTGREAFISLKLQIEERNFSPAKWEKKMEFELEEKQGKGNEGIGLLKKGQGKDAENGNWFEEWNGEALGKDNWLRPLVGDWGLE